MYVHLIDLGNEQNGDMSAELPGHAFTDSNGNDRAIYAQAWAHDIDVLASPNRSTILIEVLQEHFAERGHPTAPVSVRGLYEHTCHIARNEGRAVSDVAFEATLAATVPERWSLERFNAMRRSCLAFVDNLAVPVGRRSDPLRSENDLAVILQQAFQETNRPNFIMRCEEAHANRPTVARDPEVRYHTSVRAAVRETGFDLWG